MTLYHTWSPRAQQVPWLNELDYWAAFIVILLLGSLLLVI